MVKQRSEIHAVHGETHLTAIDIRDGKSHEVSRHECGGLFVFIGADAETGWLPADIALDSRGYVITGDDVVKTGRWLHERDPYLLESSIPGVFACGDVRSSPVKRVASALEKAAWRSPSSTSISSSTERRGRSRSQLHNIDGFPDVQIIRRCTGASAAVQPSADRPPPPVRQPDLCAALRGHEDRGERVAARLPLRPLRPLRPDLPGSLAAQ